MPLHGVRSGMIKTAITLALYEFVKTRKLGFALGFGMCYALCDGPATVRRPDTSFVARERVPPNALVEDIPLPPLDLAVEVVAPDERADEVQQKVCEYLDAGVRLVWVFWPDSRSVIIHTSDAEPHQLTEQDTLDGGSVLPGFSVSVAELFDTDFL